MFCVQTQCFYPMLRHPLPHTRSLNFMFFVFYFSLFHLKSTRRICVWDNCFYVTYCMCTHSRRLDFKVERKIVKKVMEIASWVKERWGAHSVWHAITHTLMHSIVQEPDLRNLACVQLSNVNIHTHKETKQTASFRLVKASFDHPDRGGIR